MILEFEFNFGLLISFLIGIGTGLALAVIIYLIIVLTSLKNHKTIIKAKEEVSNEEILNLINDAKDQFRDNKLKADRDNFSYCYDISKNLVISIAKKYYPNSKHPLTEVSIDEILMLGAYISKRLDEVLSHKGLKFLRKVKVSTILSLYDFKEDISKNDIVKTTRKYKIGEALGAAKKVINIVNPVWWVRKFVANKAMNIVIKKLCIVMISVVGEETAKIYSKSIYDQYITIDSGVAELVKDLEKTVEENDESDVIPLEEQEDTNLLDFTNPYLIETKKEKKKKWNIFKKKNKKEEV